MTKHELKLIQAAQEIMKYHRIDDMEREMAASLKMQLEKVIESLNEHLSLIKD